MVWPVLAVVIDELRQLLGNEGVLSAHSDLVVFECDGDRKSVV